MVGELFYVGRTKNVITRLYAHQNNPEKRARGGNFTLVPVYVGLSYIVSRAMEQALMNALGPEMLINKIRGISVSNVTPLFFVEAVLERIGDIAEDEWLNFLRM